MKGDRLVRTAQENTAHRMKLLVVCFLFALGVILGVLAHRGVTEQEDLFLRSYLLQFAQLSSQPQDRTASLLSVLLVYFRYPLLLMLCGGSTAGLLAVPAFCMVQGFSLAFAVNCFAAAMGADGILLALAAFGIRCIFTLPCFFLLAIGTAERACSAVDQRKNGKKKSHGKPQKSTCQPLLWALLLLGAVLELTLVPQLLQWALNTMT